MDSDIDVSTVGFLSLNSFNVDNEFFTVHLHNFADLVSFVMPTNDLKNNKKVELNNLKGLYHNNKLKGVN